MSAAATHCLTGLTQTRVQLARIAQGVALAGLYVLLVVALLVSVDVMVRKLFGVAFVGADELAGYAMAVATSWALAFAFFQGSHIRVNVLTMTLGVRARARLDTLAALAVAIMVGLLAWQVWVLAFESWAYGSVSNTPLRVPLWLPQGAMLAGVLLFLVSALVVLVEGVVLLWRGQHDALVRLMAPEAHPQAAQSRRWDCS